MSHIPTYQTDFIIIWVDLCHGRQGQGTILLSCVRYQQKQPKPYFYCEPACMHTTVQDPRSIQVAIHEIFCFLAREKSSCQVCTVGCGVRFFWVHLRAFASIFCELWSWISTSAEYLRTPTLHTEHKICPVMSAAIVKKDDPNVSLALKCLFFIQVVFLSISIY